MESQTNEFIKINMLKFPKLQKCSCCNRVRDIYYKIVILDVTNMELQIGDLEFCKECGNNFNKALGSDLDADQKIVKEFNFTM